MLVVKGNYGWSTPCNSKDLGGNEINCWMSVQFKKGFEPNTEKAMIDVKEFFMSAYNSKNGVQPKMVIMVWEYAQKVEKTEDKKVVNEPTFQPDDLPFY